MQRERERVRRRGLHNPQKDWAENAVVAGISKQLSSHNKTPLMIPNGIIGDMYADLFAASAFSHISSIAASNSEGSSTAIPLALLSSAAFLSCFFIRTRFTRSVTDLTETEKRGSETALRFKAISSQSFALSLLPISWRYGSTVGTSLT